MWNEGQDTLQHHCFDIMDFDGYGVIGDGVEGRNSEMIITKEWLDKKGACGESLEEFPGLIGKDSLNILDVLIEKEKLEWANWLIVRVMTYSQYVSYAIFAAEQVIEIYEKAYPDDNRPRQAIEAAKKCLSPADSAASAADSAAWAASAAARAAWAAASAAWAADRAADRAAARAAWAADRAADRAAARAAWAADSAAWAADSAAWAAASAAWAADSAAWAAASAASAADSAADRAADSAMRIKILNYGIKLLKEEN